MNNSHEYWMSQCILCGEMFFGATSPNNLPRATRPSCGQAPSHLQAARVAPDLFLARKYVCRRRVFEPAAKAPRLASYRSRGPDQ